MQNLLHRPFPTTPPFCKCSDCLRCNGLPSLEGREPLNALPGQNWLPPPLQLRHRFANVTITCNAMVSPAWKGRLLAAPPKLDSLQNLLLRSPPFCKDCLQRNGLSSLDGLRRGEPLPKPSPNKRDSLQNVLHRPPLATPPPCKRKDLQGPGLPRPRPHPALPGPYQASLPPIPAGKVCTGGASAESGAVVVERRKEGRQAGGRGAPPPGKRFPRRPCEGAPAPALLLALDASHALARSSSSL